MKKLLLLTILLCSSLLCQAQKERIVLGDEQTSEYFPILKGKRIAIFSNHTGMVGDKHLLDILLENKFNVVAIFSWMLRSVFCLSRRTEKGWGRPFSCRPNWIRALLHPHLRENRVQVKK